MNSYIVPTVTNNIYAYIGWGILKKDTTVPDSVWRYLCKDFCQNDEFNKKFLMYWNGVEIFSYRTRLLHFINAMLQTPECEIPKILWNNKDFVLLATQYQENTLLYMSDELNLDHDIMIEIVRNDIDMLKFIELRHDRDFMRKVIKIHPNVFLQADNVLKADRELVMTVVKHYVKMLKYVDDSLKCDPEIVWTAFEQNRRVLKYADPKLLSNPDFIFKLLPFSTTILRYIDRSLLLTPEFILKAIKINNSAIDHISKAIDTYILRLILNKHTSLIDTNLLRKIIGDYSTNKQCVNEKWLLDD